MHDLAGRGVDDRLVVHAELFVGDRVAKRVVEVGAAGDPLLHRLVEELVAAPTVGLGAIQRDVGFLEHRLGGLAAVDAHHDPDAGADARLTAAARKGLLERADDPRGDRVDLGERDLLAQDDELVAAEPSHGVDTADQAGDALRGRDEQLVARPVAHRVVDLLEAVEIDEQHRELMSGPARACERLIHPVVQLHSVRQTGQRIVQPARGFELDEPRGPIRRPRQHLAEDRGGRQRDNDALQRGRAVPPFGEDPAEHRRAEHRDARRRTPALRQTAPRDDDDEEHRIDAQCLFDAREVMQLVGAREQGDGAEDHEPPERTRVQPPGQPVDRRRRAAW